MLKYKKDESYEINQYVLKNKYTKLQTFFQISFSFSFEDFSIFKTNFAKIAKLLLTCPFFEKTASVCFSLSTHLLVDSFITSVSSENWAT